MKRKKIFGALFIMGISLFLLNVNRAYADTAPGSECEPSDQSCTCTGGTSAIIAPITDINGPTLYFCPQAPTSIPPANPICDQAVSDACTRDHGTVSASTCICTPPPQSAPPQAISHPGACGSDGECAASSAGPNCFDHGQPDSHCTPLYSAGESCRVNAECSSGICDSNGYCAVAYSGNNSAHDCRTTGCSSGNCIGNSTIGFSCLSAGSQGVNAVCTDANGNSNSIVCNSLHCNNGQCTAPYPDSGNTGKSPTFTVSNYTGFKNITGSATITSQSGSSYTLDVIISGDVSGEGTVTVNTSILSPANIISITQDTSDATKLCININASSGSQQLGCITVLSASGCPIAGTIAYVCSDQNPNEYITATYNGKTTTANGQRICDYSRDESSAQPCKVNGIATTCSQNFGSNAYCDTPQGSASKVGGALGRSGSGSAPGVGSGGGTTGSTGGGASGGSGSAGSNPIQGTVPAQPLNSPLGGYCSTVTDCAKQTVSTGEQLTCTKNMCVLQQSQATNTAPVSNTNCDQGIDCTSGGSSKNAVCIGKGNDHASAFCVATPSPDGTQCDIRSTDSECNPGSVCAVDAQAPQYNICQKSGTAGTAPGQSGGTTTGSSSNVCTQAHFVPATTLGALGSCVCDSPSGMQCTDAQKQSMGLNSSSNAQSPNGNNVTDPSTVVCASLKDQTSCSTEWQATINKYGFGQYGKCTWDSGVCQDVGKLTSGACQYAPVCAPNYTCTGGTCQSTSQITYKAVTGGTTSTNEGTSQPVACGGWPGTSTQSGQQQCTAALLAANPNSGLICDTSKACAASVCGSNGVPNPSETWNAATSTCVQTEAGGTGATGNTGAGVGSGSSGSGGTGAASCAEGTAGRYPLKGDLCNTKDPTQLWYYHYCPDSSTPVQNYCQNGYYCNSQSNTCVPGTPTTSINQRTGLHYDSTGSGSNLGGELSNSCAPGTQGRYPASGDYCNPSGSVNYYHDCPDGTQPQGQCGNGDVCVTRSDGSGVGDCVAQ